MRIIGGAGRRRALSTPAGMTTRPILDRVKQALFDALGAWYGTPGRLPPLAVLDLFCGGGTLGLEAYSRGASACTLVDRDRAALACLRKNLSALGSDDCCVVCAGDAGRVAVPAPPAGAFDLVFLDPPFPLTAAYAPGSPLHCIVARLGADVPVSADALCIWRYDTQTAAPPVPPAWREIQRRRYGRNELLWMQRDRSVGGACDPAAPLPSERPPS